MITISNWLSQFLMKNKSSEELKEARTFELRKCFGLQKVALIEEIIKGVFS